MTIQKPTRMHPATLSILLLLIAGCSSVERTAAQPAAPETQQFYEEFLLSRGLVFGEPLEEADVTGDGHPEVLLNAHIPDCWSCTARSFFVMSGPEPIFEDVGEGGLAPLEDGSGFEKVSPFRIAGEPSVGSYWFTVETYRWVGSGFEQDPMVELKPVQEMLNNAITGPLQPPVQVATVVLYYGLINGQNYTQAYALLSSQFQEENPFDAWAAGFATTESVSVEATPVEGNPNEVSITLTAVDSVSGQANETTVYEGTWTLTEEDGVWKLGSAMIASAPSIEQRREAFNHWLHSAFSETGLETDASIRAVGNLLSESSVPFDGYVGSNTTTYRFEGLTITAHVQEAPPRRALVESIDIQSEDWPLVNGLVVGDPVSKIDMPVPPTDASLKYCDWTLNNCIEFTEESGRISRIVLSFYTG